MNTKIVTGIVMVAALVGLVGWDLVANFNKVEGDTISEMLGGAMKAAPILAVVVGVVAGHLVGTLDELKPILLWIGEHPVVPFVYGVVGGVLFWNMAR
jgi:hypothetical protein